MNYKEIIEELKKQEISEADFAYGDMPSPLPIIGEWKEVAQHGGEGQGEDWWSVKHFPAHDLYIKIYGSYASHYGTDFDDYDSSAKQVVQKERTIKVWE